MVLQLYITVHDQTQLNRVCYFHFFDGFLVSKEHSIKIFMRAQGWSGVAMVLGKLPVPRRSANLDKSRARAYCACRMCGWG